MRRFATSPVGAALLIAVVTRLAMAGIVWLSMRAVPRLPLYPAQLPDSFLPNHASLDGWARWDSAHYVALAAVGYGPENPSEGDGLGFLPAFPMLTRLVVAVSRVAQTDAAYAVAGIVLANLFFLVSVALLANLSSRFLSGHTAVYAPVLLCLMPYSFFFNAAYSESLFLAICLTALLLAVDERWLPAALVASLASLTRLAGLALAPALLYGAWKSGVRGWRLAVSGLLPLSGFFAYSLYTAWRFDDFFAYFNAQAKWGGWDEHVRFYAELFVRHPRTALNGDPRHLVILLNLLVALVFVGLLPLVWKELPPALAVFTIVTVAGHLVVTWVSLGRYVMPAAGIYIVAASIVARPRWSAWGRDALFASLAILLSGLAILFAHGFWIV